jgi:hypothetical protein
LLLWYWFKHIYILGYNIMYTTESQLMCLGTRCLYLCGWRVNPANNWHEATSKAFAFKPSVTLNEVQGIKSQKIELSITTAVTHKILYHIDFFLRELLSKLNKPHYFLTSCHAFSTLIIEFHSVTSELYPFYAHSRKSWKNLCIIGCCPLWQGTLYSQKLNMDL